MFRKSIFSLLVILLMFEGFSQVELVLQKGHGATLQNVDYSEDGKYLITNSWDNEIVIWEMASGLEVRRLPATAIKTEVVELIPNTELLIAANDEYDVLIWNWKTDEIVDRFSVESDNTIEDVSWRNGSQQYAIAFGSILSGESEIVVYDYNGHQPGKRYSFEDDLVQNIQFSPDGSLLAYGTKGAMSGLWDSVPRTLGILDLTRSKPIYEFDLRFDVGEISFSSDGNMIACNESKVFGQKHKNPAIRFWDLKNGKEKVKWRVPQKTVSGVDFSPDGSKVAFTYFEDNVGKENDRGVVEIKETSSFKTVNLFETNANNLVLFRPDSKRVIAVNEYYKLIEEWDLVSDTKIQDLSNKLRATRSISISPDSRYLASGNQSAFDKTVKIWNLETGRVDQWLNSHKTYPTDVAFSPNGNFLATSSKDKICLWNTRTWNLVRELDSSDGNTIAWKTEDIFIVGRKSGALLFVSTDTKTDAVQVQLTNEIIADVAVKGEFIAALSDGKALVIDLENKDLISLEIGGVGNSIRFFRDSLLLTDRTYGIGVANTKSRTTDEFEQNLGQARSLALDPKGEFILTGTGHSLMQIGDIHVWNPDVRKVVEILKHHDQGIQELAFDNHGRLYSASLDGTIGVWDWPSRKYIATMVANETEFMTFNEEGYYTTSEDGHRFIAFRVNEKIYSPEIFDLQFNRPDVIVRTLRPNSTELIALYEKALEKRRLNVDITLESFSVDELPQVSIVNSGSLETETTADYTVLEIQLDKIEDSDLQLEVRNNGVVQVNMKILYSEFQTGNTVKKKVRIPLISGINSINVLSISESGIRSLPETVSIQRIGEPVKGNMFVLCFSVSQYRDSSMNLSYAVKDGRDFSTALARLKSSKIGSFEKVLIDTFFNQDVTLSAFKNVIDKYRVLSPEDGLIIYLSGHGLLGENGEFYFSTHDIDFNNPEDKGIAFEVIDELLVACPAMKKLLLMDACHSGQVDQEAGEEEATSSNAPSDELSEVLMINRFSKGGKAKSRKKGDLKNSFALMEELFTNLNNGSGAHVISAAAGDSYAYESPEWKNGVFTYVLLNGITEMKADLNRDGIVSVSELRTYVKTEVPRETNGKQKPTTREGNIKFDWNLWAN